MRARQERLEKLFPNLCSKDYEITSDPTSSYNCVAWAALSTQQGCYWPNQLGSCSFFNQVDYWPRTARRSTNVRDFTAALSVF